MQWKLVFYEHSHKRCMLHAMTALYPAQLTVFVCVRRNFVAYGKCQVANKQSNGHEKWIK